MLSECLKRGVSEHLHLPPQTTLPTSHSQIKESESRTLTLTRRISLVSHGPSSFPSRELISLRVEDVWIQHEVPPEMCKCRGQDDYVVNSVRMFQG